MEITPSAPATPRKRQYSRFAATILLLLVVFAGCALYIKSQRHMKTATHDVFDSRLENLENTVLQQETRIKALEQEAITPPNGPAPPLPHPGPMIPAAIPAPAPANDFTEERAHIDALDKEIAALKSASPLQDRDKLYHSIRLLSSFHRLSAKVLSGRAFAAELAEFEDLTGDDAAIDKPIAAISPYADNGVPTFAVLLATFDEAMDSLKADEALPPAGATLWQRIVYSFTHMITVRRIDEAQKGNSVGAILGRAQAHLDLQEIPAAITEIASLPDDARSHFTSWLEDAQLATQSPDLMDQIEENVMQKAFYTTGASPDQSAAAPAPPAATTAPKAE